MVCYGDRLELRVLMLEPILQRRFCKVTAGVSARHMQYKQTADSILANEFISLSFLSFSYRLVVSF